MPQTNYRGYREMSRTPVLKDVYLVEMKDLNYEDIEEGSVYLEWTFAKAKFIGNQFFSVDLDYVVSDIYEAHKLITTVRDVIPIFYVLTREKYLLYKLTGLL